jgi:hypothetical protein
MHHEGLPTIALYFHPSYQMHGNHHIPSIFIWHFTFPIHRREPQIINPKPPN